ncbi:MAG TPA: carboxymuconolactone decarboxylase family protein [Phycisphaerales bacterium]
MKKLSELVSASVVAVGAVGAGVAGVHAAGVLDAAAGKTERGFAIHTPQSASPASGGILEAIQKAFGFVPNMNATIAESPALLRGVTELNQALATGELTPVERNLVSIVAARELGNAYCVAGHCTVASGMSRQASELDALRRGASIEDAKLESLRAFTVRLIATKGAVSDEELAAFLGAGYSRRQALEVIGVIAEKTISTQVKNLAGVPLEAAFEAQRWSGAK